MPIMSPIEGTFCRTAPWRWAAERAVVPWALAGPLQGDVLEIGAGSGAMARGIAQRFPDATFTVTDIDPSMVLAAQNRLAGLGNVTAEVADVTALRYADATFDAVTSYLMLHHVVTWKDALAEAFRVLVPGGAFLGYDLTDTALWRAVHRIDGSPHLMVPPDELSTALADVGFEQVDVRVSAAGQVMKFRATAPAHP